MQIEGAVIREQGITFAVVVVKRHVLDNRYEANRTIQAFAPTFSHLPVVLMAQDQRGRPSYYGRPDLTRFLARVPVRAIPWRRYTIN